MIVKQYIYLFIAIILFLFLTVPFLNLIPYLDGNIDFVQTINFYNGGLNEYFNNWNTVHPPLKLFIAYPFYLILGITSFSYNVPGVIIGILGIISIYFLVLKLFDKKTAALSAILFSFYPLMVSTSIYMMRDFILSILLIISLLFYFKKKYFFYFISSSLAILTKESALLLPIVIVAVDLINLFINKQFKINKKLNYYIFLILPIFIFYLWKNFLEYNNKSSWNEWIFAQGSSDATSTIVNNILKLELLNRYAYQHWKQLIFLNFNWILILIIIFAFIIYISKNFSIKKIISNKNFKFFLFSFLFSLGYIITVLSLQTYTIPRYALPLIPILIILVSRSITSLKYKLLRYFLTSVVVILLFVSLFFSVDPIPKLIWGETMVFNNKLYALNSHLAGNDGITYNLQYLLISKERSDLINYSIKNNSTIISNDCNWIFPDPNNESKMLKYLNLKLELNCMQIN